MSCPYGRLLYFLLSMFFSKMLVVPRVKGASINNNILIYINIPLQMFCYSVKSPNIMEEFDIIEVKKTQWRLL